MVPARNALGVLSRKFHIQGAVVFQERGNTCKYAEFLKNRCNAVDGTFYDAITISLKALLTSGY